MNEFKFEYTVIKEKTLILEPFLSILNRTIKLTKNAYAPYSAFKVASIVLLENGKEIQGVNIENASYPVGICAERSALSSAISAYPKEKIKAIFISYQSAKGSNKPIFPCGMCRQFLLECEQRNKQAIEIYLSGQRGEIIKINKAADLLPFGFDGAEL